MDDGLTSILQRQSGDPQASLRYSQMMCAMGAASVEVVTEAKKASQDLAQYDYVVANDEKADAVRKELKGKEVGTVTWFKQCLITGLLLPMY